ncbi:MAG: methyl-accepting chemotaxis protein [Paenibacillaceae bacterium]
MKTNRLEKLKQSGGSMLGKMKDVTGQASKVRMQNPIKSVGLKLFLIIFLSIVVFVLVVGLLGYNTSKNIIKDKVAESSLETIKQANGKLDLLLRAYDQISLQFMIDKDLNALYSSIIKKEGDEYNQLTVTRTLTETLNNYLFTDSNIISIQLYFEGGKVVSTGGNMVTLEQAKAVPWYIKTQENSGKVTWLPTTKEGYSKARPSFALARKLVNPTTSEDVGIVLIELKTETISDQFNGLTGNGNHLYMIDDSEKMAFADEAKNITLPFKVKLPTDIDIHYYESKGQNDEDALIAFDQSAVTGWNLVGTYPTNTLVEDAKAILNQTFIIAMLAALVAVAIGFGVARMIGRPLVQLRNLMKEGEQGNLQVRTNIRSKDEIGQLGQSFNEMMERITVLVKQTNQSAQQVLVNAEELLDSSKRTALSAKEISVATEEIASGASTLAVEAERGNDLTNHIGGQMLQVVEANLQMGNSASEVRRVSEQGIEYMSQLILKTSSTEKMTRSMVEKVDKLKESTNSIRKILDVLSSVSKQTNILSLNATIEAARAGAAGKGFMVVADEIRKLADQSRQSIGIVGQITETIQQEIDETVEVLSEAYPLFQEQIASVKEADLIFKNVQNNMGGFIDQLDGVTDSIQQLEQSQQTLSEAMSNVSAVSQQSSATSEEVASLSTEQLNVSEGLVQLAEKLEALSNDLKKSLSSFTV